MDELYRRKIETDGQAAANAWRRRETRRTAAHAVVARLRGPGRPATPIGQRAACGRGRMMDAIFQDLRSGVRALVATPVVTLVAIVSLALGIGATTALFSIYDSLLLRPLPVREPGSLAALHDSGGNSYWSNPLWEQVRARVSLFDGAAASATWRFNASTSGQTDPVDGLYASGDFFEVLGVSPVLGRAITGRDDERGGGPDGPVAVLNYRFWQRRYAGAADVIGRTITLDRVAFTIVGVAPPDLFGIIVGSTFDVAVPLGTEALMRGAGTLLDGSNNSWLNVIIRLKPGQTVEQATSAIRAAQQQIRDATPQANMSASRSKRYLARPFEFQSVANGLTGFRGLRERYARPILLLMVAAGLLLLVACANIANVGLSRATARRHETAVRAALGASKARLARPLLMESLLLSGAGALLGLAVARVGAHALVSGLSTSTNRTALDFALDWRVLAFTIGTTAVAAMLFGVGPALRAAGAHPQEALASGGRGTKAGRAGVSGALVIVQVALSLVLVVSAGLFGRSLGALSRLDPGFDRDPVLIVEIEKSGRVRLPDGVLEQVINAARAIPGVRAAAASVVTPARGQSSDRAVEVAGEPPPDDRRAYQNAVTPGWFATYGTRVVAGRDFNDRDVATAPAVAVVNRAFVKRFLPGKDPLGRVIKEPESPSALTIIGVVEDAAYRNLREPITPTLYRAYAQSDLPDKWLQESISIRSAGPPVATLMRPLTAAFAAVQPNLSFTLRPLADQVDATLVQERLLAKLSGFFGGLALLLSALGLYGITAYSVTRRRGEIGIRMAMGGTPANVVRLVLRRVVWLVGVGLVAGCLGAYWAARFVGALLFGVEARDPVTFAAAVAVLVVTALLAAAVPAWRASRVDPTSVLRAL